MNIQQIRNKYKSILDDGIGDDDYGKNNDVQSQEEQSERQWINVMKQQKHKRILTESTAVANKQNLHSRPTRDPRQCSISKKPPSTKLSTQQTIISLKQKLAQSLLNCSRKDTQLQQFQQVVLRKNEQLKQHQKTIIQLKKLIQQKDSLLFEQKLHQEKLYKEISQRDNMIEQNKVQIELLKKHVEKYVREMEEVGERCQQQKRRVEKMEKEREKVDGLRAKVDRLKDDVKRLQFLLSDYQGYAPIMLALQGKHFLGKPSKQSKQLQYWYPDTLLHSTQKFLKRQQIGYGNKTFTQNLVKYIYGMLERSEKTGEKKVKTKYTSRIRQMERKRNHMMSVVECGGWDESRRLSVTRCSAGLNASVMMGRVASPLGGSSQIKKSRQFSVCLDHSICSHRSKPCLSTTKHTATSKHSKLSKQSTLSKAADNNKRKSFVIQGLQKSLKLNSQNHKSHVIMELIQSFCTGVVKLFKLDNKMLVQEKVRALCEWLRESVGEVFGKKGDSKEDQYNQTGKWKTLGNL